MGWFFPRADPGEVDIRGSRSFIFVFDFVDIIRLLVLCYVRPRWVCLSSGGFFRACLLAVGSIPFIYRGDAGGCFSLPA